METLVVVAEHRNQYCSKGKSNGFGRFGSLPSASFRKINCRTFRSGEGILPTPLKDITSPVLKRSCSSYPNSSLPCAESLIEGNKYLKATTPKSRPIAVNDQASSTECTRKMKATHRSSPIPINIKASGVRKFDPDFHFSELWAGPAYSNSPPPSSLPIPKFSLQSKRTVSLDLPSAATDTKFHPISKSAPASPTREPYLTPRDLFGGADSATKTLRRILNLDITDD